MLLDLRILWFWTRLLQTRQVSQLLAAVARCPNWEDATFTEWRPHWTDHYCSWKALKKSHFWTKRRFFFFVAILPTFLFKSGYFGYFFAKWLFWLSVGLFGYIFAIGYFGCFLLSGYFGYFFQFAKWLFWLLSFTYWLFWLLFSFCQVAILAILAVFLLSGYFGYFYEVVVNLPTFLLSAKWLFWLLFETFSTNVECSKITY